MRGILSPPFPSGSHDCRIAADCKLSRGTNFTLKTIDCSGLIRGFATINTIRYGAQIVYLDSVIIFWPRALTHSQNCTRCQKPRRERIQRVFIKTVSKHTQNNEIQKEYSQKYIRLFINPDFKRFKFGFFVYAVGYLLKCTSTNRLILIVINKINILYSVCMIKN